MAHPIHPVAVARRRWLAAIGRGLLIVLSLALGFVLGRANAAELWIGAATTSITPERPVALDGQFAVRISQGVDNPVTATAVAIASQEGDTVVDQAIMVSCDLVEINDLLPRQLRQRLGDKLPGCDAGKLVLTATHTHTAPVTQEGKYPLPREGVMQPSQYVAFLLQRLEDVVSRAWNGRKPGGVSWALGQAVVGYNRRAVYANGTAQMYGSTSRADFRNVEGGDDHGVEMLFFWGRDKNPLAVAINLACPSQDVENRRTINADFWHYVRQQLQGRLAKDLCVLGWPSAAGDQSPHLMYRKAAEERMLKARGLSSTEEIARRIAREVEDVYPLARGDIHSDVPLVHKVEDLALPRRKVTEQEMRGAQAQVEALAKKQSGGANDRRRAWSQAVVDRYHAQDTEGPYLMELHALRLGEVAIVTNPFELFLDYGVQIKGRSKAQQTFILQLTCGSGHYLPTPKAVAGGGYSAIVESNLVGPEGGQVLVDRCVKLINGMY